jgi:cell division protein FtsQ
MSKRVWNIVGKTIFWCAVVAFFVAAGLLRSRKERERTVERVSVIVRDADEMGFITPELVLGIIDSEGLNPVGMSVDSVDLQRINGAVEEYCFTESAVTYVDYSGNLTVEVSQRKPIVRVCTDEGYDFYLTKGLYVLPVQSHAKVDVPIVTGSVTFPFERGFEGPAKEWYDGEKKNHRENYNFLLKLTNFVAFTERNEWLGGKVVQIVLTTPATNSSQKGYCEPKVEVVPREGGYIVALGRLEDVEAKVERWKKFAEARVVDMNGGRLNVEYEGQALWQTPQPATKKKQKNKI